jgi:hypothetical protein
VRLKLMMSSQVPGAMRRSTGSTGSASCLNRGYRIMTRKPGDALSVQKNRSMFRATSSGPLSTGSSGMISRAIALMNLYSEDVRNFSGCLPALAMQAFRQAARRIPQSVTDAAATPVTKARRENYIGIPGSLDYSRRPPGLFGQGCNETGVYYSTSRHSTVQGGRGGIPLGT